MTKGQLTVKFVVPAKTTKHATAFANKATAWFNRVSPDAGHVFARHDPHVMHTDAGSEDWSEWQADDLLDPLDQERLKKGQIK